MNKQTLLVLVFTMIFGASVTVSAETSLERQVSDFGDGEVRFEFACRDGVCGYGDGSISVGDNFRIHHSDKGDDQSWEQDCEEGPVLIALRVRKGEVRKINYWVGDHRWSGSRSEVMDLGEVAPQVAAEFLINLARTARSSVAEDAIFPATLARDVDMAADVLSLARDRKLDRDIRKSAIFWLGQMAGDKVAENLAKIVDDDDEELEVREAAIFSLSEHGDADAVPLLTQIATNNPHPQLRRSALFWLGQKDDPRVVDLFEEILFADK